MSIAQRYLDHKSTARYDTPGHHIVVGLSTQHIRSHCIWMRRADVVAVLFSFNGIERPLVTAWLESKDCDSSAFSG